MQNTSRAGAFGNRQNLVARSLQLGAAFEGVEGLLSNLILRNVKRESRATVVLARNQPITAVVVFKELEHFAISMRLQTMMSYCRAGTKGLIPELGFSWLAATSNTLPSPSALISIYINLCFPPSLRKNAKGWATRHPASFHLHHHHRW